MAVNIINGQLSTPIDRTKRYRITWRFVAAPFVPDDSIASYKVAEGVRNALPSLGMFAVTPIAAAPGDPFVQYRIQLLSTFPGFTLADVIEQANRLPYFDMGAMTSLRTALEVSELEVIGPQPDGSPPGQDTLNALDAAARARAQQQAKAADLATKAKELGADLGKGFFDKLEKLLGGVVDVAKFAVGTAAIIGIVYVIVRYRK